MWVKGKLRIRSSHAVDEPFLLGPLLLYGICVFHFLILFALRHCLENSLRRGISPPCTVLPTRSVIRKIDYQINPYRTRGSRLSRSRLAVPIHRLIYCAARIRRDDEVHGRLQGSGTLYTICGGVCLARAVGRCMPAVFAPSRTCGGREGVGKRVLTRQLI